MSSNEALIHNLIGIKSVILSDIDDILKLLDKIDSNMEDLNKIREGCDKLKSETIKLLDENNFKGVIDLSEYLVKARHDLLNPINVIKGYSEIILEDNASLQPEFGRILHIVTKLVDSINSTRVPSSG